MYLATSTSARITASIWTDPSGLRLMCGKHGSLFEIGTGRCVDGPCRGRALKPVSLAVIDGEVCIHGIELVADEDTPNPAP